VVKDEDGVIAVAYWSVCAAAGIAAGDRDPTGSLHTTLGEDGFAADGVLDLQSLVSAIISVE